MAFCKYCGNKLEDGQECTCEEAVEAAKSKSESTADKANKNEVDKKEKEVDKDSGSGLENQEEVSNQTENIEDKQSIEPEIEITKDLPVPAQTISDTMLKRGLVLISVLAFGLVLLIVIAANVVGCGYKRPVKNVVKGLNRERAELVVNSFYPRDYVEELRDDAEDGDMEWSDITDDMDSLITDVKEVCEDSYFGDDLKISAKIIKKKKATAKDIRTIKKEFEKYDAVVKKVYRLKVRLTVKGDDEKEQVHFYIYSVKLKGGRWVLYADDKTKGAISNKIEGIYNEMDNELTEIFDDYSRSLEAVIPIE